MAIKFYPRSARSDVQGKDRSVFYYIRFGDFDIVWTNVIVFVLAHLLLCHAIWKFLFEFNERLGSTLIFANALIVIMGLGITGGAHRLWAHKGYKAQWPLRLLLMIGQTIAGQNCIYIWARDHRVHHKFSDQDGDPHNTKRGFFFTHCGWLMRKKHPELHEKSRSLDFSDLLNDPIVKFQADYYWIFYLTLAFAFPIAVPMYFWKESFYNSFLCSYIMRYLVVLHGTWFVNSAAHMFGERPYRPGTEPRENPYVSFITYGEGYHNYHHTFPSDYRCSENGHGFNTTRHFIDLMAKYGLAYDLKTTSNLIVELAKERTFRNTKDTNCKAIS